MGGLTLIINDRTTGNGLQEATSERGDRVGGKDGVGGKAMSVICELLVQLSAAAEPQGAAGKRLQLITLSLGLREAEKMRKYTVRPQGRT